MYFFAKIMQTKDKTKKTNHKVRYFCFVKVKPGLFERTMITSTAISCLRYPAYISVAVIT